MVTAPINAKYLTHFVARGQEDQPAFEVLCKVLREGELRSRAIQGDNPRGNVKIQLDRPFSSNELLGPEMVCFCDIPLDDKMLKRHIVHYSSFGLAFRKKWLAQKRGANPVFYLAQGSVLTDHRFPEGHPLRKRTRKEFFDLGAGDWLNGFVHRGEGALHCPRNDNLFFWYFLCYCKFFDEALPADARENYYMEREWRTIGRVEFEPKDIAHVILPKKFETQFGTELSDLPGIQSLKDNLCPLSGT